jgi:hypothetical protein
VQRDSFALLCTLFVYELILSLLNKRNKQARRFVSNKSDVTGMSQRTAKYNFLALYSLVDSNEFKFSSWWKQEEILP